MASCWNSRFIIEEFFKKSNLYRWNHFIQVIINWKHHTLHFIIPISYFRCPFNLDAINRALIERSNNIQELPEGFRCHKPFIIQSNLPFKDSKLEKNKNKQQALNACPTCKLNFNLISFNYNTLI